MTSSRGIVIIISRASSIPGKGKQQIKMSSSSPRSSIHQDEDDAADASDIEEEQSAPVAPVVVSKPVAPRIELQPSDFYFGKTLGEGAYARVVHAKSKKTGDHFAVKIMEKVHIKKENKVRLPISNFGYCSG